MSIKKLILILTMSQGITLFAQDLYFPPLSNALPWDTLSPESLGWCVDQTQDLYDFLEAGDTKGFILLKDGKRVFEKYFGTFTRDSLWYWASAGKTITSFLVGKAQEENYLSINDPSSMYLSEGWTNCTPEQEQNITIWHQLTMTSGLDDGVPENHCTLDTCLNYLAEPGQRWAYHNAPYTLLDGVISDATGQTLNNYTTQKLKNKIGMNGFWLPIDYNNVYFSNLRSMARFGLLAQNQFVWNNETLLNDVEYVEQMTNTSQQLNLSYGYLWWLNGKGSIMVPGVQFQFPIDLAPDAPQNMFAALGKNGQILCVDRESGIVFARMGNPPGDNGDVPFTYTNEIWQKLNAIMCNDVAVENKEQRTFNLFPNPASNTLNISFSLSPDARAMIINSMGEIVLDNITSVAVDISSLPAGIYVVCIEQDQQIYRQRFLKG